MPLRLPVVFARVFPKGPVDVLRQVLLFAAAYWVYRYTRGWVDDPQGAAAAFQNANNLIHIERSTGLFFETSVHSWTGGWQLAMDVASWIYINAQSTIVLAALVFIYIFHNERFYFVRNMFVV